MNNKTGEITMMAMTKMAAILVAILFSKIKN